jgi:hypothetical protein
MLVGAAAINSNEMITITSPTGMTQRWDLCGKRQDYADVFQATAGSSGDKTWTFSSPREAARWLAAQRPAEEQNILQSCYITDGSFAPPFTIMKSGGGMRPMGPLTNPAIGGYS